ncbi:MAG: hypothetical protein AAB787_02500 [Patescibacteria group bacterium]
MKEKLWVLARIALSLTTGLVAGLAIFKQHIRVEQLGYSIFGEEPSFWGPMAMALFAGVLVSCATVLVIGWHQDQKRARIITLMRNEK